MRSWIAAVFSSTTTAPTMSSPANTGCAAERIATFGSRVPRHCVEETPINARSNWPRAGPVSSPAGTRGGGTTRAATGFSQLVNARGGAEVSRNVPESPRTRERLSTTQTREERRPMMERKRSISSEGS